MCVVVVSFVVVVLVCESCWRVQPHVGLIGIDALRHLVVSASPTAKTHPGDELT